MKDSATLSDLVRSKELREQYGVGQSTINGWCDEGLEYIRVGRERCLFVDELLAFLSNGGAGADAREREVRESGPPPPQIPVSPPASEGSDSR